MAPNGHFVLFQTSKAIFNLETEYKTKVTFLFTLKYFWSWQNDPPVRSHQGLPIL